MKATTVIPSNAYSTIPVVPGLAYQTMNLTLESVPYVFRFRWNTTTAAFYLDAMDNERRPIAMGIRVVLGVQLGRLCNDDLFRRGVIVAVDLSGKGREAAFDDIGVRVELRRYTVDQALAAIGLLDVSQDIAPDGSLRVAPVTVQ